MSDEKMRIVVAGAAGRMGRAVIAAIAASPDAMLHAALEAPDHAMMGSDAGLLCGLGPTSVVVTHDALAAVVHGEVIIDFSTPANSVALATLAAQARIVHVVGSTGFSSSDEERLRAAARHATIIKSGNFSIGVNVLLSLVESAAAMLPNFDIEIVEMHHGAKVDTPSGTALMVADAAAHGRGTNYDAVKAGPRVGHTGGRAEGTIAIASLRGGSVVGDHTAIFAGVRERIEITHRAEDRAIFATGALAAARWGRGHKPGLYSMADVLNG